MISTIVMSLIGFIWLFPFIYLLFGANNVWWVMSLIITLSAICIICRLDKYIDKVKMGTQMKGNNVFYYCDNEHNYKEDDK